MRIEKCNYSDRKAFRDARCLSCAFSTFIWTSLSFVRRIHSNYQNPYSRNWNER